MNILRKTTHTHGSITIGDLRTLSFIEGRYFDDENYIVFQVRGGSTASDYIKETAGRNMFRLEMVNGERYSQKKLKKFLTKCTKSRMLLLMKI